MIDRFDRAIRRVRRVFSASHWAGNIHPGTTAAGHPAIAPGLLVIQIDGLSAGRLRDAITAGEMPFIARLLSVGEFELVPIFSGLPSTTPAVQAELFYGIEVAVPAFAYVDSATGRVLRMYQHEAAVEVEAIVAARSTGSLLAGGASYGNVYAGEAVDPRFCMSSLGLGDLLSHRRRWLTPLVVLVHAPALLRTAALASGELVGSLRDMRAAVRAGEDPTAERNFVQSRVAVGVVMQELSVVGMAIDLARGLPVIHGNFLGYDETAHRRGPESALASRELRRTDDIVARLWRAAHRSSRRSYDVWIMSDHGQETTDSYIEVNGERVEDAVERVAVELGLVDPDFVPTPQSPAGGIALQRVRQLGERLVARLVPGVDVTEIRHTDGTLTVTALGPLGHVYAPRRLSLDEQERFARALVDRAHVPLVLHRGDDGESTGDAEVADDVVIAHTSVGRFTLPSDAAAVLGADHPYLDAAAADLVALCHHRDAGDLVISGWRLDDRPISFPFDHGAHAGPGPVETDAFALVPPDTPLVRGSCAHGVTRPGDLRDAGFAVLRGERSLTPAPVRRGLRILTWNVHYCIGLDGQLSPERIARVIARHDPDIVCLQELDVVRARTGHVDQARAIADALEMGLAFHPTISVAEERFGDAVLSRHPLRVAHAGPLPGLDRDRLEPRGAIHVEIDVPDGDAEADGMTRAVQVVNTHLSLHPSERAMAVEALLGPEWLGGPGDLSDVVLCGDFNALSWFPTMRRLRRRLDDAQMGLDGHRPKGTFSGRYPIGRIDHVLVDPAWTVLHVEVPDHALARVASDHRPVIVDVALGAGHA
jgi:endonuclease/exonuclease/phosphatase family metal-dependent hydrolase